MPEVPEKVNAKCCKGRRRCKGYGCSIQALPTPDAVEAWNEAEGEVIAMLHVMC